MQELISFTSPLYSASFNNPSPQQARELVLNAWLASRKLAFDYAPLKHAEIRAFTTRQGEASSVGKIAGVFSSAKPSQLEEKMGEFVESGPRKNVGDEAGGAVEAAKKEKGSPSEFAFSYFVSRLFDEVFPCPAFKQSTSAKEIRLVANFGGWTAVRKVSLERGERKEAVACCATVFDSLSKKLPEFLCQQGKSVEFNSFVESFLSKFPARKSFARVPEILLAAEKEEQKIVSLAEKGFEKHLLDLFYSHCMGQVGYPPFVSTDQVSRIYPELKIPKPRGRIAGVGKKK